MPAKSKATEEIETLYAAGLQPAEIAKRTGYTKRQVAGAVERYRLGSNGRGKEIAVTPDRNSQIRELVEEMNNLIQEKNRLRDRLRLLSKRAKSDLSYTPGDFIMGVRLANMAARGKTRTLDTVREVLLALGNTIPMAPAPQMPREVELTTFRNPLSKKARIIGLLSSHGPLTAPQLKGLCAFGSSLNAHLSQLKAVGKVHHDAHNDGTPGVWSIA